MKKKIPAPKSNALLSAFNSHNTVTGNQALSHSTTGTAVLDLFGKGGAMRSHADTDIANAFASAYREDKNLALKVLFYLADVREGQGERKLFRVAYNWLAQNDAAVAKNLLDFVPEYTRFDNVLESLENTALEKDALAFIAKQLKADAKVDAPTLCAKWAPSEQASSKATKRLAYKLMKHMRMKPKAYRGMLSVLRAQVDIVERRMCTGDWKHINYEAVPSRASSIYRDAFKKHDPDGYVKFIGQVEKGEKKINASVLYPYDIVRNYVGYHPEVDRTLEAQWKALPDYFKDNPTNMLVIADTSGSMDSSGYYGGATNNVRPIDIAVSLSIYAAERNHGAFQNHFMVFSIVPAMLTLRGATLKDKVQETLAGRPCGNTNLQAAFDLILDKAVKHKVPEKDMPSTLVIISDMQFDQACSDNRSTNLEVIRAKYEASGYKLPCVVFWNVNSYQDVPAKFNDKGIKLVSGCSAVAFKSVVSQKTVTPWEHMLETVNVKRYEPIHA